MKRIIVALLIAVCVSVTGCGGGKSSEETRSAVDFTVVDRDDIPEELMTIILKL